MSAEHATKRTRVCGHKEAGGEAGGGGASDDAVALGSVDKERRQTYATHRNALLQPILDARDRILSSQSALFLEVASYFSCQDVVALGSVDKERRRAYVAHRNGLLEPTLEVLNRICRGNHFCFWCGVRENRCTCGGGHDLMPLADVDPRYRDYYEELSTCEQVEELVTFIQELVSNMRPHLRFTDAADPTNMPKVIEIGNDPGGDWGVRTEDAILKLYPRRAALAFNLALTSIAAREMATCNFYYCVEAFKGIGDICVPGSSFGQFLCREVSKMAPFDDAAFGEFLRDKILPSDNARSVLGPALTKRLVLGAPFDGRLDGDSEIFLPGGLEPYDVAAATSALEEFFEQLRQKWGESMGGWRREDAKWPVA